MPHLVGVLEHDLHLLATFGADFARLEGEHLTELRMLATRFHHDAAFRARPLRAGARHRPVPLGVDQVEPRQRRQLRALGIVERPARGRRRRPALLIGVGGRAEDAGIEHRHLAAVIGGIEIARMRGMAGMVGRRLRQAVIAHEAFVNDRGVVAARIDALVGGCGLRMIVHQPDARARGMHAVAAGAQREIDTLRRADVEGVAADTRALGHGPAVQMRQRRVMAVRVQMDRARTDIEDAQPGGLVRLHQDRRVAHGEGERAPVEHENVGHALRRIIVAMHALLDLARIGIGRRNAVEPVVDVHVHERIFVLIFLARRLRHRRDASGARDQMRKVIVRPVGLNDQHAGEPHQRMDMVLHMAVVPVGARLAGDEAVGEGFSRLHLVLRHVRHAVHVVRLAGTVQMDGVRQVVGVVERDGDVIALFDPQRR